MKTDRDVLVEIADEITHEYEGFTQENFINAILQSGFVRPDEAVKTIIREFMLPLSDLDAAGQGMGELIAKEIHGLVSSEVARVREEKAGAIRIDGGRIMAEDAALDRIIAIIETKVPLLMRRIVARERAEAVREYDKILHKERSANLSIAWDENRKAALERFGGKEVQSDER